MKPKMIWANLATENFERTNDFYSKLGFMRNGDSGSANATSFLFGDSGFVINFFSKSRLEQVVNGTFADPENQNEIVFSLSASSRAEVDSWFEKVKQANGKINTLPQDYEKGYTFCFSDPDGHKFNILYWPGM